MDDFNPLNTTNSLVDFAMSMAMANQINRMMGQALDYSQFRPTPGQAPVMWHVMIGNQQQVMNASELVNAVKTGQITGETYVWTQGMPDWKHASELPQLAQILYSVPPAPPIK